MMEKRRRMEQQGTIRLDKVSSEVDRMERAIFENSPWRMEESERFVSQDGGLAGRDSGRANDSHANERAMLMSPPIGHSCTQDGGSSSFFDCNYDSEDVSKGSTPPISLAPQAPR